jgi:hypothetical protein
MITLTDSWQEWIEHRINTPGVSIRTYNIVMREGYGATIADFLSITEQQAWDFRNAGEKTVHEILALQAELLEQVIDVEAEIAEIVERARLRAKGQWSEHHNLFLGMHDHDRQAEMITLIRWADAAAAQQDLVLLQTFLAVRGAR